MRLDFDALLPLIRKDELYERFKVFAEMEKYTLLNPPYEKKVAVELIKKAQQELDFVFPKQYVKLMICCDGGLLFTNLIYSIYDPDNEEKDLVKTNKWLREGSVIPEGTVAIGMTNYGGYIVIQESREEKIGIWDSYEKEYAADFDTICDWLDDVIEEAWYIQKSGGLQEIYDEEE